MSEDLDELRAWATRLEGDVADLALQLQQLRDELADAVAGGSVRAAGPTFPELVAWVSDWLSPTFARHVSNGFRWCPQWFQHPEAVERLTALHVAHRDAQAAGRMLPWLRDLDAQLAVLSDPAGTFAACSPRDHRPPERLTCELPPADLYDPTSGPLAQQSQE